MIVLAFVCFLGLTAGFLLMGRVPRCTASHDVSASNLSIVIPARNEERNLPRLLGSLSTGGATPREVIVVDDGSTDATASVARSYHAILLPAQPLPPGWTGKTWACQQGARAASGEMLLFLDADTSFVPGGLARLLATAASQSQPAALSALPYHRTVKLYEDMSLFFNLLMAMGAGGFGPAGHPRLFGQSLLVSRDAYDRAGGHAAVRNTILENLAMAAHFEANGIRCATFGGRGSLHIRMFPDGFSQLCEGWTKAFADGAAASGPAVLILSIVWLTALMTAWLLVLLSHGATRITAAAVTAAFVLQLFWMARQIGSFRFITCLLYPIPLVFYLALFGRSLYLKTFKRQVNWRGRKL